jgi:Phage major capsid protein E
MLDIFKNDAFSTTSLTDVVNLMKWRPSRLNDLGLFKEERVDTTTIMLELIGDTLQLIAPTPRGVEGKSSSDSKRGVVPFLVPHFHRPWALYADEVSNVRAVGSESQLMPFATKLIQRLGNNLSDFDLTEEHARLGAVTGKIVYAKDNSSDTAQVLDLFSEFNVTQETELNLELATAADGELRESCTKIIRTTKKRLGSPFSYVHSLCGDNAFDALLKNKEVRASYVGWSEAQILRESYVGTNRGSNPIFQFGGIIFENYGEIDGEGIGVPTDKFNFFPMDVDNLFKTYYAPANYNETVNTLGKRLYAKQKPNKFETGIEGEIQMNALQLCTKPGALLRAKM